MEITLATMNFEGGLKFLRIAGRKWGAIFFSLNIVYRWLTATCFLFCYTPTPSHGIFEVTDFEYDFHDDVSHNGTNIVVET